MNRRIEFIIKRYELRQLEGNNNIAQTLQNKNYKNLQLEKRPENIANNDKMLKKASIEINKQK